MMTETTQNLFVFTWGNNPKRATLKGRVCRRIATGNMRSALIEFTDTGQREIVSYRALRKLEGSKNQ
jgi:hypothetical protein